MMRKLPVLLLSLIITYTGIAQNNPQDCKDAKPICTTLDSTNQSYTGFGKLYEINGKQSCIEDGEKNSVWYVINVQSDGYLGFVIKPRVETDDYDWAVYNITNDDCSEIFKNPKLEVSCNYSQASKYYLLHKGKTGPTGDSSGSKRGKLEGPFNDRIVAKRGETYVIMVSNYQTDAKFGYIIDFSYSTAQIFDNEPPQMTTASTIFCNETIVTVRFSENVICSSVDAGDFKVSGPGGPYNVINVFSESCNAGGFYDREYKVVVDKPMPYPLQNYKLDLVGEISDVCGNFTDKDQSFNFKFSKLFINLEAPSDTVCYNTPFRLNANYNGANPVKYTWTPTEPLSCTDCTDPMATITQRTTFKITMEDANGCTGEDSITLYIKQLPDLKVSQTNFKICENDTAFLSASSVTKNTIFKWTPSDGLDRDDIPNPVAKPSKTTLYKVFVTDTISGCTNIADINVEVFKAVNPKISINGESGDVPVCSNFENIIDAGDKDPISGETYIKYNWYLDGTKLNENGRYLKVTNTGQYVAEVFNGADCIGRDTLNVTYKQSPELALYYKDTLCLGEVLNLRADIIKSDGPVDFQWFENNTPIANSNFNVINLAPASIGRYQYTIIATDKNNGCISYDTLYTEVMGEMNFSLDTMAVACKGNVLKIEIKPNGGTPGYNYTWTPEDGITFPNPNDKSVAIINPPKDTKYFVALEDAVGCLTVKSIMVYSFIPECIIKPDNISYAATDKMVELPVKFNSVKGLFECLPNSAKVTMIVDLPIFNPQYVLCDGKKIEIVKTADKANRIWNISFLIPGESIKKENPAFFTLVGDMILGDIEKGKVKVISVEWGDMTVNTSYTEGIISLNNVCNDGNLRLLNYDALFSIVSIIPNPAGSEVEIIMDSPADGNQRQIIITDMLGRIVFTENWPGSNTGTNTTERKILSINITELKSGLYRLAYCTGMHCESSELMIIH